MTAAIPTLEEALAAQAAQAVPAPVAPALPPMPGALPPPPPPKPAVTLAPELEAWVQQCIAAGADPVATRAQAEAAQAARAPAAAPVVVAPPQPAPPQPALAVSSAAPLAQPTAAGITHSVSTASAGTEADEPGPGPAPTTTRRGRPRKQPQADTPTTLHVVAATLAARAVSGPSSPAAVVEAYFNVLELLAGVGDT